MLLIVVEGLQVILEAVKTLLGSVTSLHDLVAHVEDGRFVHVNTLPNRDEMFTRGSASAHRGRLAAPLFSA